MVLGMKSKHKKGAAVRVEYTVTIEEIKPWPPLETLTSVQFVLIKWENGSESSGSFHAVTGDSSIAFSESFTFSTTLYWKKATEKFGKNYLEFSLSESRNGKVKGHLLATASLNLADYGMLDDELKVNVPLTFKKISKGSVQPALAITLELKDTSYSSPSVGFSNEASLDGGDDDDDSEITSYTDDDVSSRSSRTAGSSAFELAMPSPSRSEKVGRIVIHWYLNFVFGIFLNTYILGMKLFFLLM